MSSFFIEAFDRNCVIYFEHTVLHILLQSIVCSYCNIYCNTYPHQSRVLKIQTNGARLMNADERDACAMLEKDDIASDNDEPLTPEQMLSQAVNDDQVGNQYINADFILGSAAEVERLWSIASLISPRIGQQCFLLPLTTIQTRSKEGLDLNWIAAQDKGDNPSQCILKGAELGH